MRKGVSPYIALVITTSLLMTVVILVVTTINPTLDRIIDSNVINEGVQNLELINSAIKQVASESQGSKRTLSITVTDGYYRINTGKEWIYFDYDTKSDFFVEGTMGNVKMDKSPVFIDYFNQYQENTNGSGTWVSLNGTVKVEAGEYSIENGLSYYNYGNLNNFKLDGKISNKNGKGEIFIVPGDPRNLVLFLPFEEGSGNNMTYDYSLHNNNGTQHSTNLAGNGTSGWTTDCKFGSCLRFDGHNDYVNIGNMGIGIRTVAFWISPVTTTQNIMQLNGSVNITVSAGTISAGGFVSPTIYVDSATISTLTTGWHHVAVTTSTGINASNATLGAISNSYFNGTIDEVKIYNRALTAKEVRSEYEASIRKLTESGETDTIQQETNVTIVLANPSNHTHFDDIKLKTGKKNMQLIVPFAKVDLNGTISISKGTTNMVIEHKGLNSTTNRPIIHISR